MPCFLLNSRCQQTRGEPGSPLVVLPFCKHSFLSRRQIQNLPRLDAIGIR